MLPPMVSRSLMSEMGDAAVCAHVWCRLKSGTPSHGSTGITVWCGVCVFVCGTVEGFGGRVLLLWVRWVQVAALAVVCVCGRGAVPGR
jgi:hypothetical protein